MKKLTYAIIFSALLVFAGCDSGGVDVPEATTVDAATEADMNQATSEILDTAGDALNSAFAAMQGMDDQAGARATQSYTIPETVVDTGIKVSGDGTYNDATGEMDFDLDIVFTNYTDGTTSLDGTISYNYKGTFSSSSTDFSASVKGDIDATIDNVLYSLKFDITTTYSSTAQAVTVNGWVQSDDGFVVYNDTTSF